MSSTSAELDRTGPADERGITPRHSAGTQVRHMATPAVLAATTLRLQQRDTA